MTFSRSLIELCRRSTLWFPMWLRMPTLAMCAGASWIGLYSARYESSPSVKQGLRQVHTKFSTKVEPRELEAKVDRLLPLVPHLNALNQEIEKRVRRFRQEDETLRRAIKNLDKEKGSHN